jgi:prepilin-type N-terminal cleavage/methylation domain-containing protein
LEIAKNYKIKNGIKNSERKNMKKMVEEVVKIKKVGNIKNNKKIKTCTPKSRIFKKGFSLAEMMVVMFILSLVLAAAAPIITKRAIQDGGMESKVKALITTVNNMITSINDIITSVNDLKTRVAALESGSGTAKCDTNQVKVLDLCVAKTDASSGANWSAAKSLCFTQGMRLPSMEELDTMYYYKSTISNFSAAYYWSSTRRGWDSANRYNYGAWYQDYNSGGQSYDGLSYSYRVRCVRSL